MTVIEHPYKLIWAEEACRACAAEYGLQAAARQKSMRMARNRRTGAAETPRRNLQR
jgi:hypothetical protein